MNQEQHEFLSLLKAGLTQKRACKLIGISEATGTKWVKDCGMKEKVLSDRLFSHTSVEEVQKLISYQLKILNKIRELQESEIEILDDVKGLQGKLIPRGDIDALQKLWTTVKGKELEFSFYVKVLNELMTHIEKNDLKTAQKLAGYADEFLQSKREA